MKKIILGCVIILLSPFVIIFGAILINNFVKELAEGIRIIIALFGFITVAINYTIGVMLIVQGHKEENTFDKL